MQVYLFHCICRTGVNGYKSKKLHQDDPFFVINYFIEVPKMMTRETENLFNTLLLLSVCLTADNLWTINNNNDMCVHLPRPLFRRIHSIIPTYISWSVQWHKLVTILKFNNAVQQKQNTLFHTSVFWWSDTLGWIQPCSIVPILQTTNWCIWKLYNNNNICLYGTIYAFTKVCKMAELTS